MKFILPTVVKILNRLNERGFEAYVVGGCVRDAMLGCTPHDWDITTSALPEEIRAVFFDCKSWMAGAKYGTVTIGLDNDTFEITTYRRDGEYIDGRHPDGVSFTKALSEDLRRRDFTINAMAYNPAEGGLIDLHGGAADLAAGMIRCVGDPEARFAEDSLRILRAMRFAARLGFKIEPTTAKAIHANKEKLKRISAERINAELTRLLLAPECGAAILREYTDIIVTVIPEILPMVGFEQHNPYHQYDVWEHTLHALAHMPTDADATTRWAVLLHDIGKPSAFTFENERGHFYGHPKISMKLSRCVTKNLRFGKEIAGDIAQLVAMHDVVFTDSMPAVKRLLNKLGEEQFRRLLIIRRCDIKGQKEASQSERLAKVDAVERILNKIIEERSAFSLKDLAINGNDLIAAGIPEGKEIGKRLRDCLEGVMDGDVRNEKESLLNFVGCAARSEHYE